MKIEQVITRTRLDKNWGIKIN